MSFEMITAVTAETINNLSPDVGILLKNFDLSGATDAETLMAKIRAEDTLTNCWLGATKGGIAVSENRTFWSASFDGKRMPYVGDKYVDTTEPKISGTFVEIRPENVHLSSGAADVTTNGHVTTVQPHASIKRGDYVDKITWITALGQDGLYVVEMKNALSVTGLSSQSTDKDILTLPFEFTGHQDSVVFDNNLPIKYLFYRSSGAAAASGEETGY